MTQGLEAKEAGGYLAVSTRLSGRLDDWLAGLGRPHHSDGMAPLELFQSLKGISGMQGKTPLTPPAPIPFPPPLYPAPPGGSENGYALRCIAFTLTTARGRLESWRGGGWCFHFSMRNL